MADRPAHTSETDRTQRIYDKTARRYDRQIRFFERILFAGGREWVCSRASGDTLEIAFGTARNLPFYPEDVRLTGIELSPKMVALAHERERASGGRPTCGSAMSKRSAFATRASTASSRR